MPYFIGRPCIDLLDKSCMDECPVDCIYEGDRKVYINPVECIDCGACEPVCPVEAISSDREPSESSGSEYIEDNAAFFSNVLPGRETPIGNPGGAADVGRLGVDTPLVVNTPVSKEA